MPRILIAIGSQSRVGKDTLANFFAKRFEFKRLSFASGVYSISGIIQVCLSKKEEKDRRLLQFIGEGLKGIYGPNVWVDKVKEKILDSKNENIVVTDLRFKEEWMMLKDLGFKTVRIFRKNRPSPENPNHKSETDLDDCPFDFGIDNCGTLEDFEKKANDLLNEILEENE